MCALSVWQDQTACQILAVVRVFMHHAVMRICISHRLFICAQNGFFGDFEGEYVKILCSDPPKCTTLREYASVGVSRVVIGSSA